MKCRNCETEVVATAEGDWMHVPMMSDRPCDHPERPAEIDLAILAWLETALEWWADDTFGRPAAPGTQAAGPPGPKPEGVREVWVERPLDDPRCTPTMIRFRAVLDDGTALHVTRDFACRIIEVP
ncbi:hypothetical protein [Actinomadura nitritigenes]|uniref:hypothetical protein n=1 Tax=Actinomadura nitritigenes TaxID=134602 RepID=UPI003D8D6AFD